MYGFPVKLLKARGNERVGVESAHQKVVQWAPVSNCSVSAAEKEQFFTCS